MPRRKKSAPPAKASAPRQRAKKKLTPMQAKREATKKTFTIRSLHLGTHFAIAGSAIAVLLMLGYVDRGTFSTLRSFAALQQNTATIGLEFDAPLSLSVLVARKEDSGYTSITNKSDKAIRVSSPAAWSRLEVTGAPLSAITQEIPVFGFTRWTLPARAGIRFMVPSLPGALFFDSPSASTAAVEVQSIDLTTSQVTSRVVLVQKRALVNLWGNEE